MKYYIDINVSGFEDARTFEEIVQDTLQNTDAANEDEARKMVNEAIENGNLIEALPEDIFNEESEAAYNNTSIQYSESGNYIEVAVETFGSSFWIGYTLKNGDWIPGELERNPYRRVNLRGCEMADVERLAEDAIQEWVNGFEESFYPAFRAAYVLNTPEHKMLAWKYDPSFKSIFVLYSTEDGCQETYEFNRDGDALGGGEHLGAEEDINNCYGNASDAEADGFQVPDELRRNWR